MTASVTMEDREECLAAGMDGFIAKPVRPDEFHRTIDQFTRSHSAAQSAKSSDEDLSLSERQTSDDVIDLELARRQLPGVRRESELWPSFCSIMIKEIQEALTDKDKKRIQRAAHRWKRSGDIFGERRVVDVARRIELAGKRDDVDEASEMMPALIEHVSQLRSALAAGTGRS